MPNENGPGAVDALGTDRVIAEGRSRSSTTIAVGGAIGADAAAPVAADVTLPIGLDIDDVAVHITGSRAWASLPGRPMINADGRTLRDDKGKVRYALAIRWSTRELSARFGERVVALVRAHDPGALDDRGAS